MSVSPSLRALGGILGAVMLLCIKEIEKRKEVSHFSNNQRKKHDIYYSYLYKL